jgi:hypothetical protein
MEQQMRSDSQRQKWRPVRDAVVIVLAAVVSGFANGGPPDAGEALVVRLVHPERQAFKVLKLFDGSRAPHPAAPTGENTRGGDYVLQS